MTLPFERRNAIKHTRRFLYDLMDPKKTPKVPLIIRRYARACLKHYPNDFDMGQPLIDTFGEHEFDEQMKPIVHVCGNRPLEEPPPLRKDFKRFLNRL